MHFWLMNKFLRGKGTTLLATFKEEVNLSLQKKNSRRLEKKHGHSIYG
jgi:hypothetical protein